MQQDDRPVMNLGHLAVPKSSTAQEWLERQAEKKRQDLEIVAAETRKWFGDFLPDEFYEQFAEKVVTALDQQI